GVLERGRRHLVARLAPGARRPQQACVRQRRELLRDGLPCDRQLGGKLGRGRRAAGRYRLNERAPARVTQRGEDAVYTAVSAVHAMARNSKAGVNCGEDSTTCTRVPSTTGSSSIATVPPSSQSRTSRLSSSTSRTTTRRSSPSPQRKTPSPPGRPSSSAADPN